MWSSTSGETFDIVNVAMRLSSEDGDREENRKAESRKDYVAAQLIKKHSPVNMST